MRAGASRGGPSASRAADFLAAQHMVIREERRSQEVLERFFGRRRILRKSGGVRVSLPQRAVLVARSDLIATVPVCRGQGIWPGCRPSSWPSRCRRTTSTGFDLKLHWHRRFDNEPRNRWLREQVAAMVRDDPSMTLPPVRSGPRRTIRQANSHCPH